MEVNFKLDGIRSAADKVLAAIGNSTVIAFHGEMGAGKTTFVHALCEAIGVKDNISSPTFSIINQYFDGNKNVIYHIDLYRLKDENEAIGAGVEDCFYSGDLCLVEWPERTPHIFPADTVHLYIKAMDSETRQLKMP